MKIEGLANSLHQIPLVGQTLARAGAEFEKLLTMIGGAEGGGAAAGASGHDFRSMTPSQMRGVASDLLKSGEIDMTQLLMLQQAGMPLGRLGANGEVVPLSASEQAAHGNRHVDYLQVAADAIAQLERTGSASDPKSGYGQWQGILTVLQENATRV